VQKINGSKNTVEKPIVAGRDYDFDNLRWLLLLPWVQLLHKLRLLVAQLLTG